MADIQLVDLPEVGSFATGDLLHNQAAADGTHYKVRWENFRLPSSDPVAQAVAGLGAVSTEDVVPIAKGGTNSTTASQARTALGLGASSDPTFRNVNVTNLTASDTVTCDDLNVTTSSDRRLKDNVFDVVINYDKLDKLCLKTGVYNKNAKKNFRGTRFHGVIAQDAKEVFPWCVGEDSEGYLYVDYPKLAMAVSLAELQRPIGSKVKRFFKQLFNIK